MKVIVNILDNSRAVFIMELLHSFSYVKVQPVTDENVSLLSETDDNVAVNLLFKPLVMSVSDKKSTPTDFDCINRYETKKPSDYFGTLSEEDGEKFKNHVNNSRLEWERNF